MDYEMGLDPKNQLSIVSSARGEAGRRERKRPKGSDVLETSIVSDTICRHRSRPTASGAMPPKSAFHCQHDECDEPV